MIKKILLIALALTAMQPRIAASQNTNCHFTLGVVPQFEQRRIHEVWTPVLKALEQKTGCTFELAGAESIPIFEQNFKKGQYDIAYMNPYHSVMAHDAQGYVPIVRSGKDYMQGILVVAKDSPIENVKALDGKTIAFPSPNALGASLLMRAELTNQQKIKFTPNYVKTHGSVYLNVAKSLAEAGGGVNNTFLEQPKEVQDALRVIYRTAELPTHPIVIHPRIGEKKRKEIQAAFLTLATNHPKLVNDIPMEQPIATDLQEYQPLKSMGLEAFVQ